MGVEPEGAVEVAGGGGESYGGSLYSADFSQDHLLLLFRKSALTHGFHFSLWKPSSQVSNGPESQEQVSDVKLCALSEHHSISPALIQKCARHASF
jgi:hypothetical protein